MATNNWKRGTLTDEEKRKIEQLIKFEGYADIARKLNRNPATVRKYCQRNHITKDAVSVQRMVDNKTKKSLKLQGLSDVLTEKEFELAAENYSEIMKQFGGDVLPTEEDQVIDFCIVSCLLNRALLREKEILKGIDEQNKIRTKLEKQQEKLKDDGDDDARDDWYDKIEQVDVRIANLAEELKEVKKNQLALFSSKQSSTKAMHASRDQRHDELSKANENWADFVYYLKKNEVFRKQLGYEIESMRLGVTEEYIKLSALHTYADGEQDFPILNSDVVLAEKEKELLRDRVKVAEREKEKSNV